MDDANECECIGYYKKEAVVRKISYSNVQSRMTDVLVRGTSKVVSTDLYLSGLGTVVVETGTTLHFLVSTICI